MCLDVLMYDEVDNFGGTGLDWIRLVFELWHLDAVLGLNIWVVGWVYQSMNGVFVCSCLW